ncbi:hypothetical protein THRCLA_10366 [Thraustotheca clavata]|uniref:Uncharacterized protein n=1 Tax=Thraustotheca clavata TaxID=74557 RepID=A0A1V9YRT0_9STRA|nr:hypothetical protein THRCLA_10366 [Thraustotheca clavata]
MIPNKTGLAKTQTVTNIRNFLIEAAKCAEIATLRRNFSFVSNLLLKLLEAFKQSATFKVFGVPKTLNQKHLHTVTLDNDSLLEIHVNSEDIANEVIELLYDKSYGTTEGLVSRCGETCPFCKCPCTKTFYHESAHYKLHDTFHQIGGVAGRHYSEINELWELSCVESVLKCRIMMIVSKKGKEKTLLKRTRIGFYQLYNNLYHFVSTYLLIVKKDMLKNMN